MDYVKDAFDKVKQDINFLRDGLDKLREELKENRELMIKICESVQEMSSQVDIINSQIKRTPKENPAMLPQIKLTSLEKVPAHSQIKIKSIENIPAYQQINSASTEDIPAHLINFKPLNEGNLRISTGNRGVPADRQTNQQTDRQVENSIENAAEMIKSLDNLKKEIHKKFKKLTEQEWLVFSTIYQFDEEKGSSDYRVLAEKLNLTESSIRDYVSRLINKGIPVDKTKLNNKNIKLNVSKSLKQIASLSTIINLRDL